MADWFATSTRVPRKVALHGVSKGTAEPLSPVIGLPEAGDLLGRSRSARRPGWTVREGDVDVARLRDAEAVRQVAGSRGPQRLQAARGPLRADRQPVEVTVRGQRGPVGVSPG